MSVNPQLDLAYHFVQFTGCNIFLTGKAGTGKTTFLHTLRKTSLKRMVIVAPTGVAAINAGGVTIHSFFQLPFGPYIPGQRQMADRSSYQKFNQDKINLIRSLDLLVIDEISMVRADTLDAIDEVLRRYKNRNKPFGGAQLLMIGDLHQLSPVIKDEEWALLRPYYQSHYFFSSRALQQSSPVNIELKHIYRQTDEAFITLLNHIRENSAGTEELALLNQRYNPGFEPADDEGYITLTTHNYHAKEINQQKLAHLDQKTATFEAEIRGDFPEYAYPADALLELKEGAQVMFVKNDSSREKLFFNGKIGRISSIEKEKIRVTCPGDPYELEVIPAEWQNFKYELDPATKEINERTAGTFTQYPLKLAWAITIHKSQGLTFEKAIIDAGSSFAHGQVYVALSRCKSFEGMVLRSPISLNSVKTDGTVSSYTRQAEESQPGDEQLLKAKLDFQRSLLFDLFTLDDVKTRFFHCQKLSQEHESSLTPGLIHAIEQLKVNAENELYPVAERFKRQIGTLFLPETLPEDDQPLQERIKKACTWFAAEIENRFFVPAGAITLESDNKEVKKLLSEALNHLRKELFIRLAALKLCQSGFVVADYLKVKSNAEMDFQSLKKAVPPKTAFTSPSDLPHPALYTAIKIWRDNLAAELDVPVYRILPQKTLAELVAQLPQTMAALKKIKGIGDQKANQYGEHLLSIIADYSRQQDIAPGPDSVGSAEKEIENAAPAGKANTKAISFNLLKEGKSIAEIAKERGMTSTTVTGHLAYYAATGELDIADVFSAERVEPVLALLRQHALPESPLTWMKTQLGETYSFDELRLILNHFKYLQQ